MHSNAYNKFLDDLSDGQFSQVQKELAAKDATIEALQINVRSSVLKLSAKGNTVKEISDTLNISQKKVREIIKNCGKP
ncbi:MAG: LuxR C-terminal-related transcriptional regulator [Deltaproteobacteria bacterium]|nr:LuxR C-terminal-related transcriptional regulator [Deltaproteobacteria bacterium]